MNFHETNFSSKFKIAFKIALLKFLKKIQKLREKKILFYILRLIFLFLLK